MRVPPRPQEIAKFLNRYDQDNNEWWRTECGDHMNLFDAAIEHIEVLEQALVSRVLVVESDHGYETGTVGTHYSRGEVLLLSLPCPGRWLRHGGIGGQAITPCGFCGEMMSTTAGPHSAEGRYFKPVIVDETSVPESETLTWVPFDPDFWDRI